MVNANPQKNTGLRKIQIRIALVGLLFFLIFGLIAARAFELHLTDNYKMKRLVKSQYQRRVVVAPKRGNILDAQGETLAIDIRVESVYATPNTIENPKSLARALAETLNISKNTIEKRLKDKKRKFAWIKRRITEEEAAKLRKMKLVGIGMLPEYKRFYPNGSLAANLIGAVGYDAQALSGLELTYDKILKSDDPPLLVEQDAKGRSYAPYALVGLEHPNQISLTIDKTIQYIAERELKATVEKTKARGGVSIVIDADTGAILSLAVFPTFDPNDYSNHDFKNWRNRAVTDIFEPGSIFKSFTAAAALDSGVADMDEKIHCGNGNLKVGKNTIHDHHPYGLLNLTDIIKFSSNICSYKLAHRIGKERFYKYIKGFGFGAETGIEMPGEMSGLMAPVERLSSIQLGTIGFGQGISVTPLQVATAYGAIANGGFLMKPYIVKEVRDSRDNVIKTFGPKIVRRVISETTSKQTIQLLKSVVEKGGTGTQAQLKGYSVAGKTGTAQKVIEGKKGYAKGKYIASFVGFAPAEDARLVVLVSIDEPTGSYYGGVVSAPVFQKVMDQSLAYLKIPPSQKGPKKKGTKLASNSTVERKDKKPDHRNRPEESASAKDNSEEKLDPARQAIPDFRGLSVREVLRKAQASNIKIKIRGSGICNEQSPSAGVSADLNISVTVQCQPPEKS